MHHWQIEAPNLMNLSPHSGLHVPPSSLDIKSPQKFPPKAAGATEVETASCMQEFKAKGGVGSVFLFLRVRLQACLRCPSSSSARPDCGRGLLPPTRAARLCDTAERMK